MENAWTFEKFIFGIIFNGRSMVKYTNEDAVKICVEKDQKPTGQEKIFKTHDDYKKYIYKITGEDDQFYNTVHALKDLLNSMD